MLVYQWSYKSRHLPSAMFRQNMSDVTQKWERRKNATLWKARRPMPQYKAKSSVTRQQVFINIHTWTALQSSLVVFFCMSQSRKMINHSFPCNIKFVIITSESIRSSPRILLFSLWLSHYTISRNFKGGITLKLRNESLFVREQGFESLHKCGLQYLNNEIQRETNPFVSSSLAICLSFLYPFHAFIPFTSFQVKLVNEIIPSFFRWQYKYLISNRRERNVTCEIV
jgi:hypothetical protein